MLIVHYDKLKKSMNTELERVMDFLEVENADIDRDIDADYRKELMNEMENDQLTDDRLSSDHRFKQLENIISGSGGHNANLSRFI